MNRPTPDPSQEWTRHSSESCSFPSWEGLGVGSWFHCMRKAIGGTPCFHYRSVSPSGSRHQDAVERAAVRQFGGGDATTGERSCSSARSQSNPIRAELELCAPRSAKSSAYASVFTDFVGLKACVRGCRLPLNEEVARNQKEALRPRLGLWCALQRCGAAAWVVAGDFVPAFRGTVWLLALLGMAGPSFR